MKLKNILYAITGLAMASAVTGCDGEKDLIIIDGNLPIKTSTLYMVGDATPNGWSIDAPTGLEASEEDPLVFTWEGNLNVGEMKLCLTTGSWDAAFIRPMNNGDEIGKAEISKAEFQMHSGDPDEKWKVTEAGVYHLTFDLRNWTMSSSWLKGQDTPEAEPIETDVLYIVGDATAAGWNIDAPAALEKKSEYVFEFEGPLVAGEFKACISTGDWGVKFIRPLADGCKIDKSGVESEDFVFVANPDNKWRVADAGIYHLTFDLEKYTITAIFKEELNNDKNPIESATLYMIGDATPGGWSMDDATAYTVSDDNKYIFSWEGELVEGNMKACLEPDGTFSCPFIRPATANCEISKSGVASPDFVYTTNPDDQWRVTEAGTYRITFDLENRTISVKSIAGSDDETEPLETATLYIIGDATPGGWSMDDLTALTADSNDRYVFTWEGNLKIGEMKACLQPDGTFSCPFLRPTVDGCKIGESGVASSDLIYTTDPDNKWKVEKEGRYKLTFNLKKWTIEANYLD
ncbi:MAG: SusF/SusE family outer membrane protein [Duncaniella sp.]|nr:SusF/SusE family outer membrane protein [Duncaniella sp.]